MIESVARDVTQVSYQTVVVVVFIRNAALGSQNKRSGPFLSFSLEGPIVVFLLTQQQQQQRNS